MMKRYILPVQLMTLASLFWLGLVHAAPAPTQTSEAKKPSGNLCDPVVLRKTINGLKRRVDGLTTSVKTLKDKNKALKKELRVVKIQVNQPRVFVLKKKWELPNHAHKTMPIGGSKAMFEHTLRTTKRSRFFVCYSITCSSPNGIYYVRITLDGKAPESGFHESYIRGHQTVNACGVWSGVAPGKHTFRILGRRGNNVTGSATCWRAGLSGMQFVH